MGTELLVKENQAHMSEVGFHQGQLLSSAVTDAVDQLDTWNKNEMHEFQPQNFKAYPLTLMIGDIFDISNLTTF